MTLDHPPQPARVPARPPASLSISARAARRSVVRHDFAVDVAVVGLDDHGLSTALELQRAGSRVVALETSERRRRLVGQVDVGLPGRDPARLAASLGDHTLTLSGDVARVGEAQAVVVCVPAPVDDHGVRDLGALSAACAVVVGHARPGQLLLLATVAYVGATAELLATPLRDRGLDPGSTVHVAYSPPAGLRPGAGAPPDLVPRLVAGWSTTSARRAVRLVGRCSPRVRLVPTVGAAEAIADSSGAAASQGWVVS